MENRGPPEKCGNLTKRQNLPFNRPQHFHVPFRGHGTKGVWFGHHRIALAYPLFLACRYTNMDAWVRSNTPPPPESSYPKLQTEPVPIEEYPFPAIPGVNKHA